MRIVTALVIAACAASVPALAQQDLPNAVAPLEPVASEATAVQIAVPGPCGTFASIPLAATSATATPPADAPAAAPGDPDIAFICAMIAHQQAAIDMAQAQIAGGADDWARQKAQAIIDSQQAEIAEMTDWVATKVGATE